MKGIPIEITNTRDGAFLVRLGKGNKKIKFYPVPPMNSSDCRHAAIVARNYDPLYIIRHGEEVIRIIPYNDNARNDPLYLEKQTYKEARRLAEMFACEFRTIIDRTKESKLAEFS